MTEPITYVGIDAHKRELHVVLPQSSVSGELVTRLRARV